MAVVREGVWLVVGVGWVVVGGVGVAVVEGAAGEVQVGG